MDNKKKVEAVLFSIGKEVSLLRLAELCELETEEVRKLTGELKEDYENRDHSLKIIQRGDNVKLTVKDDFLPVVSRLVEGTDLDKALMETLAVIAWKYPVTQSEVIKLRHNKAYDHIKRLMEMEFIEKEKTGRTYKLKLTKKFFEYFDLPSDEAKSAFLGKVPEKTLHQAEEVEKEADEAERLISQEKREKAARTEIKGAVDQAKKVEVVKAKVEEVIEKEPTIQAGRPTGPAVQDSYSFGEERKEPEKKEEIGKDKGKRAKKAKKEKESEGEEMVEVSEEELAALEEEGEAEGPAAEEENQPGQEEMSRVFN